MATASKITPTGALLVNGSFDEVSYSTTGASGAYVYKNGVSTAVNTVSYSQDFTQWGATSQPLTKTRNATTAPDGSTTATLVVPTTSSGGQAITKGAGTAIITTAYTFSVYAKSSGYNFVRLSFGNTAGSGYAFFNLSTGAVGTVSVSPAYTTEISAVGNSWYRCSITFTTTVGGNINGDIYVQSADNQFSWAGNGTSGVYLWGAQFEQASTPTAYVATGATTSININNFAQRTIASGIEYVSGSFDEVSYSANGGTGQLGVNGVNTATNIVSYSQQFNQTSKWGTGNVTVTINTIPAPDNSLTGTKLIESANTNRHLITQSITVTAGALSNAYSASVFAKAAERGNISLGLKEYTGFTNQAAAFFNLSTGTVGTLQASNGATVPTANITPVGNNWYKCSMSTNLGNATATAIGIEIVTANSSSNNNYAGDGTSGVYIWGAQTEQAAASTTYVATGPTPSVNLNNFARRTVSTGVEYVSGEFDEVTGA